MTQARENTHLPEHSQPLNIVALVPAFNEEESISDVIRDASKFASRVIVCDDGSTDATYRYSVDSGAEVIRHSQNSGYGAALRTLFLRASDIEAEAFVTIDSDGQHDSRFIPKVTEPVLAGEADIVIGSRFLSKKLDFTPPHRRVVIKLINRLFDPRDQLRFTDLQSGFRAYNSNALSVTCPTRTGMGASTEIIKRAIRAGLTIREAAVPIYYNGKQPSLLSSARQFVDVFRSTLASSQPNEPRVEAERAA
jgi:glycosyltransferase involved in cell wall biosynthesis